MASSLYASGVVNGVPLIAGMWKMKTETGFPLDLCVLEIQQRGCCPDWAEMLADAGAVRAPAFEIENAKSEMFQIIPGFGQEVWDKFVRWFMSRHVDGNDFSQTCLLLLQEKRA